MRHTPIGIGIVEGVDNNRKDFLDIKKQEEFNVLNNPLKNTDDEAEKEMELMINEKYFFDKIGQYNRKDIIPYHHLGGTGEVYKVVAGGKSYKIRFCKKVHDDGDSGKKKATKFEKIYKIFPDSMPTYIGRQGDCVCRERIEEEVSFNKYPAVDKYKKLGELCAELNKISDGNAIEKEKNSRLKSIDKCIEKKIFTWEEGKKIKDFMLDLFKNPALRIGYDLYDLHYGNIAWSKDGRLYIIDEEAITTSGLAGSGIAKLILDSNFNVKDFFEGYNTVYHNNNFDKDYFTLVVLKWLLNKLSRKTGTLKDRERILQLVGCEGMENAFEDTSYEKFLDYFKSC